MEMRIRPKERRKKKRYVSQDNWIKLNKMIDYDKRLNTAEETPHHLRKHKP